MCIHACIHGNYMHPCITTVSIFIYFLSLSLSPLDDAGPATGPEQSIVGLATRTLTKALISLPFEPPSARKSRATSSGGGEIFSTVPGPKVPVERELAENTFCGLGPVRIALNRPVRPK